MHTENYAEIHGSKLIGAMPMFIMLAGILICAFTGNRAPICYWAAGFTALFAGFLIYKDKNVFSETVIEAMGDKVLCTVIFAWLFSGIMAKILSTGELANGLIWLTSVIKMPAYLIPLITFIIGAVMSTATGTSMGTIAAMTPLMVPVADAFGCNIALTCGAVVSGAAFGDNLAPVSDTTIASALTQETQIGRVVRSRLKYSLTGAAVSCVLFVAFGIATSDTAIASAVTSSSDAAGSLIFMVIPVLVVILMLRQASIVTALLVGDFTGIVMLFTTGRIDFAGFVGKEGIIATGISGMLNVILFTWFIFVVSGVVKKAGSMDALIHWLSKKAKGVASAEIACMLINIVTVCCIVSSSASCALVGPIDRQIMRPYHVARDRTANMVDGLSVGICGMLPYGPMGLSALTLAIASGCVPDTFAISEILKYNFHCMALIVLFIFATVSGWGRTFETDEMLAQEGIYIDPEISIPIPEGAKLSKYTYKKN